MDVRAVTRPVFRPAALALAAVLAIDALLVAGVVVIARVVGA